MWDELEYVSMCTFYLCIYNSQMLFNSIILLQTSHNNQPITIGLYPKVEEDKGPFTQRNTTVFDDLGMHGIKGSVAMVMT